MRLPVAPWHTCLLGNLILKTLIATGGNLQQYRTNWSDIENFKSQGSSSHCYIMTSHSIRAYLKLSNKYCTVWMNGSVWVRSSTDTSEKSWKSRCKRKLVMRKRQSGSDRIGNRNNVYGAGLDTPSENQEATSPDSFCRRTHKVLEAGDALHGQGSTEDETQPTTTERPG